MFPRIKRLVLKGWLLTTLISLLAFTVALAASGDLDTTFGTGGKVLTDFAGRFDRVFDIALQSNGKIVAVGYSQATSGTDFSVTRYNPNGLRDSTFSGDGKIIVNFGGDDTAWAVEVQSDNKIVVAGETCKTTSATGCNVAMVRFNANGSLDTTFSGDGKVVTDFAGNHNAAKAIAIQSDNKIVLAGYVFNGTNYDFAIYRYNPNGSLDTTFSKDGRARVGFGVGRNDFADAVDIQDSDRKIVVVGSSGSSGNGNDFALVRLTPGGAFDTTFSGDGRQLTNLGADDLAYGFAGQPDGKLVVVGQRINLAQTKSSIAVARYNPNGSLDTTFNFSGFKVFSIFTDLWSFGYDVFVTSNGKIVVGGSTDVGGNIFDFTIVRLNPGGTLDRTFSGDGKVTIDFGGDDLAYAISRQPSDGKYVLGGSSSVGPGGSDFALVRVRP